MKIRIFAALLALSASMPAVAAAQAVPPRTAAEAADRLQALAQWMQRITDALAPSNEAGVVFFRAVQGSTSGDPAQARAKLPEMRAATAKWREALALSEARLSRIEPLEHGATFITTDQLNRVLTDARALVLAMQQLAGDTDQLTDALERNDVAAIRELAPKLVRGGFLQMRQQVTIYRGRQALLPPDRSAHQMAAVTIRMYEAMSAASEGWFAAFVAKQPGAAAAQRAKFLELAGLLEQEVTLGRRNLAREKAEFASFKAQAKDGGSLALIAAAEPMAKLIGDAFLIGDELVAWLRLRADVPQNVLAKQQQPELLAELVGIEQRYVSVMAQAAAAMGQARR